MNYKLIGAITVILGCGGCGLMMASHYLGNIRLLRNFITVLDYMRCELQYRATPLPQLCRTAGEQGSGKVQRAFLMLADELDSQISPDVYCCMSGVISRLGIDYEPMNRLFLELGSSLGKFDITGQIKALENAREQARELHTQLQNGKENRLRSYQTLGLCAGAAIAILFV